MIQLLADTQSIKQIGDRERSDVSLLPPTGDQDRKFQRGHAILDELELVIGLAAHEPGSATLQRIASLVCDCLLVLFSILPDTRRNQMATISELRCVDFVVHGGLVYPGTPRKAGDEQLLYHLWTTVIDAMEDERAVRLLQRCLSCINDVSGNGILRDTDRSGTPSSSDAEKLYVSIARRIIQEAQAHEKYALAIWLKRTFLRRWEGHLTLRRGTMPMTCLRFLAALDEHDSEKQLPGVDVQVQMYNLFMAPTDISDVGMAQSWLDVSTRGEHRPVHLLDFPFLFTKEQRATYFRTANHLRMQTTHADAEKASTLRARMVRNSYDAEADSRLAFLEEHYLLLNIGRTSALRDSFNQIWQRRASELLRPLRVRLGEVDAFEVGHDLGGVQMEFFNLLCREILDDQLGMFASDSKTGLSYFRPGCLQPLYMFEQFGLLFALAVYNGITLPVSFPIAFYRRLLGQPCDNLESIQDGWPAMHKSLKDILAEDIPGLECVFALEANGVRLSVSSFEEEPERETPKTTARVAEATAIVHHPEAPGHKARTPPVHDTSAPPKGTQVALGDLRWPGWSFEPSLEDETVELTPENKEQYVRNYISWLTYASVASQWHHFLTGFYRILPRAYINIFTATQLQPVVEGTKHISIPELRHATEYEGYNPSSNYINAFWAVVTSWPEAKQKLLLKFVTAAERVPLGGARHVTFKISRVSHPGAEEGLPTSSTCFGTLMLPRYANSTVLERKLTVAVEMGGEGFGTG